jgi:class 3 adenylate cyclase/CHASE3 domain sensor protein
MNWFSKLPFQFKIFASFILIILLAVMISMVAVLQFKSMHTSIKELNDNWMPSINQITVINKSISDFSILQYQHINATNNTEKRNIDEKIQFNRDQIRRSQAEYEKITVSKEEKAIYQKVLKLLSEYFAQNRAIIELSRSNKPEQAIAILQSPKAVKNHDALGIALNELIQLNVIGGIEETKRSESIYFSASQTIVSFLLAAIVFSLIIAFAITRDIYKQIGGEPYKIAQITQQVATGNLDIAFEDDKFQTGILKSVQKMILSLKEIAEAITFISKGNTSKTVIIKSDKDVLALSINQMIHNFKDMIYQTNEIAKGNLEVRIQPNSNEDELGLALQAMNLSLIENKRLNEAENWIKDGINGLSQELSGDISLKLIAEESIQFIARYLEAAQGALYIFDRENQMLNLFSSYAYVERNFLSNHFKVGEGIIGQVAFEKKPILLKNIKREDIEIQSGLLSEKATSIYAMPLLYQDNLYGVIELASFEHFDELQRRFLDEAKKIVATYLHSANQAEEVKKLLVLTEEAKQTAEERAVELQQTQEELLASSEELKLTNIEIEELNKNLEVKIQERTIEIYQQKEEIEAQRDNLAKTFSQLEEEKHKADLLLLNILPEQIAEELKLKGKTNPRNYQLVSVLFTDFEGFTNISAQLSSDELVTALNKYFEAFEHISDKHQLEKIKTIGDAFMAAGGIPEDNIINPMQAILAGLEIQRFMLKHAKTYFNNQQQTWKLRIGINTGELIAGVIGKKKFAYDIWGDAVNVASRMESKGEAGRVNISENTYQLVKDFFECEYRGQIDVKGKGAMNMYFVNGIKPELSKKGKGIEINELFEEKLHQLQSFHL